MVQAELDDRKTMTRRSTDLESINERPNDWEFVRFEDNAKGSINAVFKRKESILHTSIPCRYGRPGDLLWVRESWAPARNQVLYKANERYGNYEWQKWKPSIHMPKSAARIWLQVESVRVERLQDISEEDAKAEGVKSAHCDSNENCPSLLCKEKCSAIGDWWNYRASNGEGFPAFSARSSFESLWESINGTESWKANPWVWVVSFKVLSTTGKPDLQTT
jgi:hypothetical protein